MESIVNQYYEKEQPLFFLVFPIVLFVPVREQDPMLLLNVLSICKHLVEKYHTSKAVEMHPDAPHGPTLLRMPRYFTCQRESAVTQLAIVIGSYILV